MQRLAVNITDAQRTRLDQESEESGLGLSELVRRKLDRDARQQRETRHRLYEERKEGR